MKRPGLAKATRGATWRRRGGEALTREAEELLFALAERMSLAAWGQKGVARTRLPHLSNEKLDFLCYYKYR